MAAQTEPPPGRQTTSGGGGGGSASPRRGEEGGGRRGEEAQPGRPDEEAEGGERAPAAGLSSEERECRICYNPFDAEARAPKVLECLHTFCLHCLSQMHRHQARAAAAAAAGAGAGAGAGYGGGGGALPPLAVALACPLCRHRTALPEGHPHLLPFNTRLLPPPPPPDRLQVLPLARAARPVLQRPLPEESGQRAAPPAAPAASVLAAAAAAGGGGNCRPGRAQSRRQDVRTVRCVCIVFTFFSMMVVSITGPLFLNYSGWVELFMVSLFLVVAIVLALFSIMPYLLHSHEYRTVTTAFLAGERASGPRGPPLGPVAAPRE